MTRLVQDKLIDVITQWLSSLRSPYFRKTCDMTYFTMFLNKGQIVIPIGAMITAT